MTGGPGPATTRPVVAMVTDLMDQSRIRAAIPDVAFVREPGATAGAAVVVVDLGRSAERIAEIRAITAGRIIAFGAHVDDAALAAARAAGADVVLPRSRFFHDPAAAVRAAR